MEKEIWKPIDEYEGLYEVSSLGRIRTLRSRHRCKDPEGVMIPQNMSGSYAVVLYKNRKFKSMVVSHLVFQAFNQWNLKLNDIEYIRHLDGDISNNSKDNLITVISLEACKKVGSCL